MGAGSLQKEGLSQSTKKEGYVPRQGCGAKTHPGFSQGEAPLKGDTRHPLTWKEERKQRGLALHAAGAQRCALPSVVFEDGPLSGKGEPLQGLAGAEGRKEMQT